MEHAFNLTVNFGGTIYDDWRLPVSDTCLGWNCTGSEWGHLYYSELGNSANYTDPTNQGVFIAPNNRGLDSPLFSTFYWTGTIYSNMPLDIMVFYGGSQYPDCATWSLLGDEAPCSSPPFNSVVVRSGDVAPTVAPEPISSLLFVTGGTLLAGRRYIKSAKKRKCRSTEVKNKA